METQKYGCVKGFEWLCAMRLGRVNCDKGRETIKSEGEGEEGGDGT